jgi:hypothetical protein
MVDSILTLAVSIQSNKGVFALLLGSGISRSSGIPTGWEVAQYLIRRLAKAKNEECEPDPSAWFRKTFNLEPDYSQILGQMAGTSAERGQLLQPFFEPTEAEKEDGLKQPTLAHQSIAGLIAHGYIRVVITTNFDRLLERALTDIGIEPVVASTPEAFHGVLPLAHSRCTILKVNGDYLNPDLKNTHVELERYKPSVNRLLDQVFDEYGLIVAGWSAESDTALYAALERCKTRRFSMYWCHRGTLSHKASRLVTFRGASVLNIAAADSFFEDLAAKVNAIESFSQTDLLSGRVAVARLKKYLATDRTEIKTHDLFFAETERVKKIFTSPAFWVSLRYVDGNVIQERLNACEAELAVLLPLSICGAFWASPAQETPVLSAFKRIADLYPTEISTMTRLQLYPALLLFYGMGLAAAASGRYSFLKSLFNLKIKFHLYKAEQAAASIFYDQEVLARQDQKTLPGRVHQRAPLIDHLFETLREPLREYIPDDRVYDQTFDWFEYLHCLVDIGMRNPPAVIASSLAADPEFTIYAPVGRFAGKDPYGPDSIQENLFDGNGLPGPKLSAAFEAVLLRKEYFPEMKAAFDRHVTSVRRQWSFEL